MLLCCAHVLRVQDIHIVCAMLLVEHLNVGFLKEIKVILSTLSLSPFFMLIDSLK